MKRAWFLLLGLGWAMTPLPVGGQSPDAWSPADLRAGVALHGPPPLPYQGLRLRVWVENLTNQPLGPLPPVEDRCHVLVRGPRDADYRLVADALPLPATPPADPGAARRRANLRRPRLLEPRGGQSVSFPVVASWGRGEDGPAARPTPRPVFTESGTYHLKWVYREPGPGRIPGVEATLVVEVAEAKRQEAEALARLRRDETLLALVLHPQTEPTAEEARRLEEFLVKFAASRYAPNAHFALTRHYLKLLRQGGREWRLHEGAAMHHADKAFDPAYFKEFRTGDQLVRWNFVSFPDAVESFRRRREALPRPVSAQRLPPWHFVDGVEWLGEAAEHLDAGGWDRFRRMQPPTPLGGEPARNPKESN